jgi:hypothetical protein
MQWRCIFYALVEEHSSMSEPPALHIDLPYRRNGSFGTSQAGLVAEWITATWVRFNIFVCWIFLVLALLSAPERAGQGGRLLMLIVSPLAAVMLYAAMIIGFSIFYFVPVAKVVAGYARLLYLWLFCRLIAQKAPVIELPLWG